MNDNLNISNQKTFVTVKQIISKSHAKLFTNFTSPYTAMHNKTKNEVPK